MVLILKDALHAKEFLAVDYGDVSVREALGSLIRSAVLRVETFASAHEFASTPTRPGRSAMGSPEA